jgi:hypothetical protein
MKKKAYTHRKTTFLFRHQKALFLLIGTIGILRVLFYNAAFPFFNNVDEQAHFDLVVKYSNGYMPRSGNNFFSRESANFIVRYASPEFLKVFNGSETNTIPPPLWTIKSEKLDAMINTVEEKLTRTKNHEAFSPPTYYLVSGLWYAFGKSLGISGIHLLYWVRFLNGILFGLLLWVSYKFCSLIYADNPSFILGVFMLLAFFPQDAFYSINSDALSPLFFMVSFYLLYGIYTLQRNIFFYFFAGLLVAATFLIKLSNLPVVFMLMIFLILTLRKQNGDAPLERKGLNLTVLCLSCALPIAIWMAWNLFNVGDIMATAEKTRDLGWKRKSFSALWDHPIFSLQGAFFFLSENIKTFWRGEFVWGLRRIASPKMDFFYVFSTGVFLGAALIHTAFCYKNDNLNRRLIEILNLFFIGCAVLVLAALSIQWDYRECWYPSSESPYFTSGRLILFMLVPFVILYVKGHFWVFSTTSRYLNPLIVLIVVVVLIAASEFLLNLKVVTSPYNWFHSL